MSLDTFVRTVGGTIPNLWLNRGLAATHVLLFLITLTASKQPWHNGETYKVQTHYNREHDSLLHASYHLVETNMPINPVALLALLYFLGAAYHGLVYAIFYSHLQRMLERGNVWPRWLFHTCTGWIYYVLLGYYSGMVVAETVVFMASLSILSTLLYCIAEDYMAQASGMKSILSGEPEEIKTPHNEGFFFSIVAYMATVVMWCTLVWRMSLDSVHIYIEAGVWFQFALHLVIPPFMYYLQKTAAPPVTADFWYTLFHGITCACTWFIIGPSSLM